VRIGRVQNSQPKSVRLYLIGQNTFECTVKATFFPTMESRSGFNGQSRLLSLISRSTVLTQEFAACYWSSKIAVAVVWGISLSQFTCKKCNAIGRKAAAMACEPIMRYRPSRRSHVFRLIDVFFQTNNDKMTVF
jgi:hypothetical protein